MKISESEYMQLLEVIDAEPVYVDDPVTCPPGNDDGRIKAALKALLASHDSNALISDLQLAFCAYYDIVDKD